MTNEIAKRERVLAVVAGKEVDHVPVCMRKLVPGEYYSDYDRFAEYQACSSKIPAWIS